MTKTDVAREYMRMGIYVPVDEIPLSEVERFESKLTGLPCSITGNGTKMLRIYTNDGPLEIITGGFPV